MTVTYVFVAVIIVLFIVGMIALPVSAASSKPKKRWASYAASAPNLLTTVGVFGTFCGILLGLLAFDVNNVTESVPLLLEGMKTAFISSVAGMFAAILFKILQIIFPPSSPASSGNPIEILSAIQEGIERQNQALNGGEDSSLLTQLQKLRTTLDDNAKAQRQEVKDGFQGQILAFEKFAEVIAENNSKALIEALNDVIKDFNEKLTEQFGENFKHLNEAVGKLLEWQEHYRLHIERTETSLNLASDNLANSSSALDKVQASVQTLPAHAQQIENIVNKLSEELNATTSLVGAISDLRNEVKGAMPEVSQNIDALTKSFANKVEESANQLNQSSEKLEQSLESSFAEFDKQMQSELVRSLELMGNHLASISSKLGDDYEQLAKALSYNKV